jgi:hypothetical protein
VYALLKSDPILIISITIYCRWPTRVFATDCLRKIVVACEEDLTHFDLETAREAKKDGKCKCCLTVSPLIAIFYITDSFCCFSI